MTKIKDIETQIAEKRKQLDRVQGTDCSVYTKITGYYRSLKDWNNGKRAEYSGRGYYDLEKSKNKK